MTKYRIRLISGRVLGPFDLNQLHELKAKGHIKGNEEAQVFPTGNWALISSFEFYDDLLGKEKFTSPEPTGPKEETFIIDLSKIRSQKQQVEIEKIVSEERAPEPLTETIRLDPDREKIPPRDSDDEKNPSSDALETEQNLSTKKDHEIILEYITDEDESNSESVAKENLSRPVIDNHERTIINPIAQKEIEKLRNLQRAEAQRLAAEAEQKKIEEEKAKSLARLLNEEEDENQISPDASTQMIRIDKTSLLERAEEAEEDIEDELQRITKLKKEREKKEAEREEAREGEEDEEGDENKKKKKKILITLAVIAILYAFLFPEEKSKTPPFKHLETQIVFPIPFDVLDENKSAAEFKRGLELFNRGDYQAIIEAGKHFRLSYENNTNNSAAFNFMVRSYSEQLKHSLNFSQDSQTIFNLVQSKRFSLLEDPNGAIGLNLFYMNINKPAAAMDITSKYLKRYPKNVTQDLFAFYLQTLLNQGKQDVAKQFYLALARAPDKNRYTYQALIDYHLSNQEPDKAMEYADDGLKRNSKISIFYLEKAELLLGNLKPDLVDELLKKVETFNFDSNNLIRAKYFELKGFYFLLKNKPNEAAVNFEKSLALFDSDELRIKLSGIQTSDGKFPQADKIIIESRPVKDLLKAKEYLENRNYTLALSYAIKATEINPGHIPSQLFLAKVQQRIGQAYHAIKTLEALVAKYPKDKQINLALIDALIDSYKFQDAKKRIQIASLSEFRDSWEYASINAKLHVKMGDTLQALSWLKNSISLNPINDRDIFFVAQILLKKANFDGARLMLYKCMELDPLNPDYRIAYARLLYETEDDLAAIGYLLSLRDVFGDNPKVLSEIAIFYHRSGKEKDFQEYKLKLEREHSTDKALYEFLIKSALIDEKPLEVPPLVEKLLAIEPGELEQMMTAGRVLFESGNLKEAEKWFQRVKDKMPTYPRVHYYLALLVYQTGDLEKALKFLEESKALNGDTDDSLVLVARIHQLKGEFSVAEDFYKKAQKINPKSYDAILGLADLSVELKNYNLALDLYMRTLKLRQDDPIVHKKIGDVYKQLGQGALAIESYQLYLEMDPDSPDKSKIEADINLLK
jgi:tetratricopeptide (TPR) repeat protein